MKYIILLLGCYGCMAQLRANDTLRNHAGGLVLEAGKYTGSGQWGFIAGHNSEEQQQFGEKYYIDDPVKVAGVVAHLATTTGTVTDPGLQLTFRLWKEDPISGIPAGATGVEEGHLSLGEARLGEATVILFANKAHMEDAFFVTMDLGDYGHDGLAGDTVGLYHAPHGSRTTADIANIPFRNVYQPHGHGTTIEWKDFYADNGLQAPLATHLALYPVIEMENVGIGTLVQNGISVMSPYPQPAVTQLNVPFRLDRSVAVGFRLMDMAGRTVSSVVAREYAAGQYEQNIDLEMLPAGSYILSVLSEEGAVGIRINKL